jgi:PAS domain S-box-containing protein
MGNERVVVEAIHRGVADYVNKSEAFLERLPLIVDRVTRPSQIEAELRLEKARLAEAQQIAQLGSWEWDVVSNRVVWSDGLYRIYGRDPKTFGASYEAFLDCVHPEDRSDVAAVIQGAYSAGQGFRNVYRILRAGDLRFVEGRGSVITAPDGRVVRMVGTAQDVTERELLNQQLSSLNESLKVTLREREVLLQEIHHRVKNNLQVVSSLIHLQMRKLDAGDNREALGECRSRIQAIALIHEKLYQSSDYARVRFNEYAESLAIGLLSASRTEPGEIRLDLAVEDIALALDQAIPCGLVLNELISNAIKHGFKDGRGGTIRIEFSRAPEDLVSLSVSNDGIDLPSDFEPNESPTLGLHLVLALASQLDARFDMPRGRGSTFRLTFPLLENEPARSR